MILLRQAHLTQISVLQTMMMRQQPSRSASFLPLREVRLSSSQTLIIGEIIMELSSECMYSNDTRAVKLQQTNEVTIEFV